MNKPILLVVEDEPISLEILVDTLHHNGYETITAGTGAQAWEEIGKNHSRLDGILLDRLLPDMDSLNLLQRLKADNNLVHVPVIMQTSMSSDADIADGMRAGAYYYLTKPFAPETLLAIVRAAVQDWRDYVDLQQSLRRTRSILNHLMRAEFWFRTQEEARNLGTQLAHIAPDPERVVLGLTELMLNAVEHGNLGITYSEKSALIAGDALTTEVDLRLKMPKYRDRRALLTIERRQNELVFMIRDEGNGFDWTPYVEMSPTRAFDTHGRGIAMSRLISFDRLEYRGSGNEVECAIKVAAPTV
jgi:DNA-binding response OmpR family regulator